MATDLRQKLKTDGDNYRKTVLALKALANELFWDDAAKKVSKNGTVHCGRTFRTSDKNRISKNEDVTPDLAIQIGSTYRAIAEAKLGFGPGESMFKVRVDESVAQSEKYDDDLTGWPVTVDGQSCTHPQDVILLVNYEDYKKVISELNERIGRKEFTPPKTFAVVYLVETLRSGKIWANLSLEYGAISDAAKSRKLELGIPIRPELLDQSPVVGQIEVYDHPPPRHTLMDLIHKEVVLGLTRDERESLRTEAIVEKKFTLKELQKMLKRRTFAKFDERDPELPNVEWLRDAMVQFVEMGWAHRQNDTTFVYILSRKRKGWGDTYGRIIEWQAKAIEKKQAVEKRDAERKEKKAQRLSAKEETKKEKQRQKEREKMPLFNPDPDEVPEQTGSPAEQPKAD